MFMIDKKSRTESEGTKAGQKSGVEVRLLSYHFFFCPYSSLSLSLLHTLHFLLRFISLSPFFLFSFSFLSFSLSFSLSLSLSYFFLSLTLLSLSPFYLSFSIPFFSPSSLQILVNEPYTNGFGGSGQYTKKIFHLGSRLPMAIRAMLPKSALQVHEEVRNAAREKCAK